MPAVVLLFGRFPKPGFIPLELLLNNALALNLVLLVRLPRILLALLLGASLSMAGNAFQILFRNPLVEPGFLGVSQGAAFGAALAILVFPRNFFFLFGSSSFFAFVGLGASFLLATKIQFGGWIIRLVMSGISVSALFSAGIGVLKYMADPLGELQDITFWLLGALHTASWDKLLFVLPFVLPALIILYLYRWKINLLSLEDRSSFSLGLSPAKERIFILAVATVAVAVLTAIAGIISWVGLIIPHIARRLAQHDIRNSSVYAALLGAGFVLLCDTAARTLTAFEIPLGILTAFAGALSFILILTLGKMGVSR